MKIPVTQNHIASAYPCDPDRCMLAKAIQDATGDSRWKVGCYSASLNDWEECVGLPPNAIRLRRDFDCDRPVEPFEFELPISGQEC